MQREMEEAGEKVVKSKKGTAGVDGKRRSGLY